MFFWSRAGRPGRLAMMAVLALPLLTVGYTLPAQAFLDAILTAPIKVINAAIDARTAAEIADDNAISAKANARLLDHDDADWASISILIFARHVVLTGAVETRAQKTLVEKVVGEDKKIRSLHNEIVVTTKDAEDGDLVDDTVIQTKIDAALTTTSGINSVNMRWSSVSGRVIIMGIARSKAERSSAIALIKGVKGVKSVKSYLRIVPKD